MNQEEAKKVVDQWAADHPEWKPFFSEQNAGVVEGWLVENNKPVVARSLTEAFETLAREGKILSKDGSAPPGKPRARGATAVTNPEPPPQHSGPSAAEEYTRFYHANPMVQVKRRMSKDPAFKKWLEDQTRAATMMHSPLTAQFVDPEVPSNPKPVFTKWKFTDLGADAPVQPRQPGGVKIYLQRRARLVAGVDRNKRTLALAEPEWAGLHFSLSDARLLLAELAQQSEPAEIR